MNSRLLTNAILSATFVFLFGCNDPAPESNHRARHPQTEPTLVLNWSAANSGDGPGRTGWKLDEGGWPAFIERHVRPGIEWCEASSVKPIILIHHAFGQWQEKMHLDGWDFAQKENADFLTEDFATDNGWKGVTKDYDCYAYVGDVALIDRLRDLPRDELAAVIRRNLQPYADAGFKGIYVDYGENAIDEHYEGVTPRHSIEPSADVLLFEIADEMFPVPTGVEAAPRNFPPFEPLHTRNVIVRDPTWRLRFGGFTPAEDAKFVWHNDAEKKTRRYSPRHSQAAKLGWPNRDHLQGTVWRTLVSGDDPQLNVELARTIADDGDVAVISPHALIQAKIKASELFDAREPVL